MTRARRLAIGTVQFGLDYGVSNFLGKVPFEKVADILTSAAAEGIDTVDTAASYGDAEQRLAEVVRKKPIFQVVTKTAPVAGDIAALVARAKLSAERFGSQSAYGLLVHSAADLHGDDGDALWNALQVLRERGHFAKIGISAYASDDPVALARRFRPDLMQIPISLLDQKLVASGVVEELKSLSVEIHVRSVFAQGAIFLDPDQLPGRLARARSILVGLRDRLTQYNLSPLRAAIGFALSIEAVDRVVVGITSITELSEIIAAANDVPVDVPWNEFSAEDVSSLDPRRWV